MLKRWLERVRTGT